MYGCKSWQFCKYYQIYGELKTAGKTATAELIHNHFYGVDKETKTLLEVLSVSVDDNAYYGDTLSTENIRILFFDIHVLNYALETLFL